MQVSQHLTSCSWEVGGGMGGLTYTRNPDSDADPDFDSNSPAVFPDCQLLVVTVVG